MRRKKDKKEVVPPSQSTHLSFDEGKTPFNIKLFPQNLPNCATVETSGWGYVGSVVSSTVFKGRRHYWEYIFEHKGWGCMVGCKCAHAIRLALIYLMNVY